MTTPHRKRKVTYNTPGHAHFLTFSCQHRLPLLSRDRSREWVVSAIQDARMQLDFDLWAYVLMPEHVHLLLRPRQAEYRMERILTAIKRPVAERAKAHLVATNQTAWLARLTVKKGEHTVFRFWQAGGGYDENLWSEGPILEKVAYIHANPVKRRLVEAAEDWFWSSARFWAGDLSGPLVMDPISF